MTLKAKDLFDKLDAFGEGRVSAVTFKDRIVHFEQSTYAIIDDATEKRIEWEKRCEDLDERKAKVELHEKLNEKGIMQGSYLVLFVKLAESFAAEAEVKMGSLKVHVDENQVDETKMVALSHNALLEWNERFK